MEPKAIFAWSSGKDSALSLSRVLESRSFNIVSLVTTVTEEIGRVTMHGTREELLDAQAAAIGIPLKKIYLPYPCPDAVYEERVGRCIQKFKDEGVTHIIFGDLFLSDVKRYREERVIRGRLECVYPLWGEDTGKVSREILSKGFRATLSCVDTKRLDRSWVGKPYDATFLSKLPPQVDPCGEKGEFHTFVHEGPIFRNPLSVSLGEVVSRQGFDFIDLLP